MSEKIIKSPCQVFLDMIKFLRLCASVIGLDLLDPNYRENFITGFVFCWICAYPIFVFSTILKKFKENWKIILEAFCLEILVFQGSCKFFTVLVKKKKIMETYLLLLNVYETYEKRGQSYANALMEGCERIKRAMKVLLLTCLVPGIGVLITPFIMLLVDNSNRFLIMPMLIPYIDVDTTSGYYTTLGLQASFTFLGSMGIFASDIAVLMYFMQSFVFVDILRLKIEDLNSLLNEPENSQSGRSKVMENLMDIVKWQELYSRFTDLCNDIFYWFVVVCVGTAGIAIVLTLFMIVTSDWPGAYPYLVIGFYTLYMYCILGTKIEICNEQFMEGFYEINWYNMTPEQQKIVYFMLMRSQNPKNIDIAGILPLSVATALRITKTIYSIFMMMLKFLVE